MFLVKVYVEKKNVLLVLQKISILKYENKNIFKSSVFF